MNENSVIQVLKLVRQRKRIPVSMIAYRLNIPGKYVESIVETLQEYDLVDVTSQSNGDKIIEINQIEDAKS